MSGEPITGAESHRFELIKGLANTGHEIFVPIRKKMNLGVKGVHTFTIKGGKVKQSKAFLTVARKEDIEVVYTRNYQAGELGIWLKRILGTKLIYEVNGLFYEEYLMLHGLKNKRKAKRISKNDLKVATNADAIIAVANEIKENYIKRGIIKDKIHVIENGVNEERFKLIPKVKNNICSQFNIPNDSNIILFVGHFYAWQGIDVLIRSMKYVVSSIPNAKLLIVGSGEENEKLKLLVKENNLEESVIFTGPQKYEVIPEIISSSDVCVSLLTPSKFGALKMWEYLACSKPVVATRMRAYEFIEKEHCGTLVKYGDETETANAITSIITNKKMAENMGNNGRQFVLKDHTWKIVAEKTSKVFEEVTQH